MHIIDGNRIISTLVTESTEDTSAKIRVVITDSPIDITVSGTFVEACIQCSDFVLVFATDDCLFEEVLNITLVDFCNSILDSASLFWPYNTGVFAISGLIEPNKVVFEFLGDKQWQIEVLDNPTIYIPLLSEPSGSWRQFKFKRCFRISRLASALGTPSNS
ncbi:hypothetical protein [Oceanobacter mangrovi]|uniref:hypothetical protein n=1 Tax=Oceanobacter mangrovi TaxID=2862510 RepID=UPI001C8EB97F|nr:hypothetical protein [Oceanobacter mangrovi]